MIDSQMMRIFAVVARSMSMTRAAEELGITVSAVSHSLKKLEADLGCTLIERLPKKLSLTPAGRDFLTESEAILQRMARARERVTPWADTTRGQLRIGCSTTACLYLLPPALREFRESFPKFTVKIEITTPESAVDRIAEGRIDLALAVTPARLGPCSFLPVAEEQMVFLVNPFHPWALRQRVQRSEISGERLILPERGTDSFSLIEDYFRKENVRVRPFLEINSEEAVKQFVRLDIGAAILPEWIARSEIHQRSLASLPLGRRRLVRDWGILAPKERRFTFAENVFIGISRNVAANVISSANSAV